MAITGFHHVALYTDDMERAKRFYEALGGKVVHSFVSASSGKEIFLVELAKGAVIELLPKPAPHTAGSFPHVALQTDDCDEAYKTALAAGAEGHEPPREMMLGTLSVKNAFLFGPDGEILELFEVR